MNTPETTKSPEACGSLSVGHGWDSVVLFLLLIVNSANWRSEKKAAYKVGAWHAYDERSKMYRSRDRAIKKLLGYEI